MCIWAHVFNDSDTWLYPDRPKQKDINAASFQTNFNIST